MKSKIKIQKNKGFSIVELLIVLAIFGIITSMILARNNQFNNIVKLKNLAYEIALTLRQAQVFGTSVKGFVSGSQNFDTGYGVHFGSGNDSSFILFADLNNNGEYDGSSETVEILNMRGGNKIKELCVFSALGTRTCGNTNNKLNVIFKRPSNMARITTDIMTGSHKATEIQIISLSGETKIIAVQVVGQISIK